MSNNLDRLLTILRTEADLIDRINKGSTFRYKSIQRLILETGMPFLKRVKPTTFKGRSKQCFQNCFQALWNYPELSYCKEFVIDDNLPLAISHAWLVNDALEVIDPTLNDKTSTGATYFGVIFSTEFVIELATKTKHYGILDSDFLNEHQLLREGFPTHALR